MNLSSSACLYRFVLPLLGVLLLGPGVAPSQQPAGHYYPPQGYFPAPHTLCEPPPYRPWPQPPCIYHPPEGYFPVPNLLCEPPAFPYGNPVMQAPRIYNFNPMTLPSIPRPGSMPPSP